MSFPPAAVSPSPKTSVCRYTHAHYTKASSWDIPIYKVRCTMLGCNAKHKENKCNFTRQEMMVCQLKSFPAYGCYHPCLVLNIVAAYLTLLNTHKPLSMLHLWSSNYQKYPLIHSSPYPASLLTLSTPQPPWQMQ